MATESVGLQKITLKKLMPDIYNALIVGVIIAKQQPRKLLSVKVMKENADRAVWNFTLRDSPSDYINATCWGTTEFIFQINDKFQVGDLVDVIRPKIDIRKVNDNGEQFRPMVTSPYSLTLNENYSELTAHEGHDCSVFLQLLQLPTKPIAGFVTLADVHNMSTTAKGQFVDLLGAVGAVGSVRNIKTRDGRDTQLREVVILDRTSPGLKITLWDPEIIIRAGHWKPRDTVLFMADMRVEWSDFHRSAVATVSSRTVITENPAAAEAHTLRTYARTAPIQPSAILDQMACNIPDPSSIKTVMSCQHVLDKIEHLTEQGGGQPEDQQFTALLYVVVTQFDLDGFSGVVSEKCIRCKTGIDKTQRSCNNAGCPAGSGAEKQVETSFDVRMMLSDQTASLISCRLTGRIAESVLGCTVQEFSNMQQEEKRKIKWKYLMERCEVRIIVLCMNGRFPLISVISCALASPTEVANKLPHY